MTAIEGINLRTDAVSAANPLKTYAVLIITNDTNNSSRE